MPPKMSQEHLFTIIIIRYLRHKIKKIMYRVFSLLTAKSQNVFSIEVHLSAKFFYERADFIRAS